MSAVAKNKWADILTWTISILGSFQFALTIVPGATPAFVAIGGTVIMFLVNGLTGLKQYLSAMINEGKAMTPTLFIFIIATLGGLNELFDVVPMSEIAKQWVKFIITFSLMVLNLVSKTLYPNKG
jgi:hypothetical protein